jgi:hypothetical protein
LPATQSTFSPTATHRKFLGRHTSATVCQDVRKRWMPCIYYTARIQIVRNELSWFPYEFCSPCEFSLCQPYVSREERCFESGVRRLAEGCVVPVDEEPSIHLHDRSQLIQVNTGREFATPTDLPIWIIDDFPESKANREFVSSLYSDTHEG